MKPSEKYRTLAYVVVSALTLVLVMQIVRIMITNADFEIVHNQGLAFGFFRNSPTLTFVLNTLAISAIIYIAVELLASPANLIQKIALSMLLAGGFSNYYERIWLGYIVDYLEIQGVTVFNLADVMVDAAIAILLSFALYEWIYRRKHNKSRD